MNVQAKIAIGASAILALGGISGVSSYLLTNGLDTHTDLPASDYDAALAQFAQLRAQEDERINPLCRSQLLTHGHKTSRVLVLVHGLTNCPQQYVELAPLFYQQGYNVLIPRMPRHGFADRMTDELKYLTAEELRDFGSAMVDIAHGLGEHITFVGISVGGVVAAWVAQHRADVDKVALIAPSLTLGQVGFRLNILNMKLLLVLPNILTQNFAPFEDGPSYSYLGYSSHALGQMLRLGASVMRTALKKPPATQSLLLITNACDTAVNNLITWQLISAWHSRGLERLEAYEFPKKYQLIHDIIDPQQRLQQTTLVYPVLIDLITRQ